MVNEKIQERSKLYAYREIKLWRMKKKNTKKIDENAIIRFTI